MIRPLQRNDLTFVSRIFLEGFGQSVLHYVGGASSGIERALHDIFAAILEHQPQGMLVAEAEGCIGGYVIAIPSMPYLWWHVISRGHLWQWAKRYCKATMALSWSSLSLAQTRRIRPFANPTARHTTRQEGILLRSFPSQYTHPIVDKASVMHFAQSPRVFSHHFRCLC